MMVAVVDRLVHHATIFEMNVASYRRRAHSNASEAAAARRPTRQSQPTPDRRAATSKTSIPLARQSRHDDHANAATPDSYPDCRFPIQIAALHWMTTGGSR